MTRTNFETALEKGRIGERIIRSLLEQKGWCIYQPNTPGAHAFDMMALKDKRVAIALDVKAKAMMNARPETGVNLKHYHDYRRFAERHKMDFWIFFVDEHAREIYGNRLAELDRPRVANGCEYPRTIRTRHGKEIILWPRDAMVGVARLSADEAQALREASQRSYAYRA